MTKPSFSCEFLTSKFNPSEKFGSDIAEKAQTTVARNWRKSLRRMGRLGVILFNNCTDRWEGLVR